MKKCERFHFQDLEPRDRLLLKQNEPEDHDDSLPAVTCTVARAYMTSNFGPVVESVEGQTYYLYDYDVIEQVIEN